MKYFYGIVILLFFSSWRHFFAKNKHFTCVKSRPSGNFFFVSFLLATLLQNQKKYTQTNKLKQNESPQGINLISPGNHFQGKKRKKKDTKNGGIFQEKLSFKIEIEKCQVFTNVRFVSKCPIFTNLKKLGKPYF